MLYKGHTIEIKSAPAFYVKVAGRWVSGRGVPVTILIDGINYTKLVFNTSKM
jgi:hypothetical protein